MTTNGEAPVSISTTAYYKGFSMIITKRDPDLKNDRVFELLNDQIEIIDTMIEKGFQPSWNSETNKAALAGQTSVKPAVNASHDTSNKVAGGNFPDDTEITEPCPVHEVPMKAKEGKFGVFYSHARKLEDGTYQYCNGKGWK